MASGIVTRVQKDQPTPGDLHIDQFLTNLSVGWAQDPSKFIAGNVFPIVPVQKQSDKYAIWDKGFFYRDEVAPRPLGGRPNTVGAKVGAGTYLCEEEGLEYAIDDRTRANADAPLDPDRTGANLLTTQEMIHRDREWCAGYFKKETWGTDMKGAASSPGAGEFLQLDQTGAEPVDFIDEIRDEVAGGTGYEPNVLVLGRDVFRKLKNNPELKDRIKYTQRGVLTAELLAQLFEVDKVLVPGGVVNSAKEGAEDDIDFIVPRKDALLVYAAKEPSIEQPSGGYGFAWTGLLPGLDNAYGGVIERGRESLAHSDILQIRSAYDQNLVAPELGVFLEGVVS